MTATEPLALRPPRHRIERRAILWWTLNALIWGAILVGGLGLLYVKAASVRPWLGPVIAILGAISLVNITIMPTWRYLVHRWECTEAPLNRHPSGALRRRLTWAVVWPWLLAALPAWLGAHDRRPVSRDAVGALAALDSGAAGQGSDRGYLYALACSVYRSA